MNTMEKSGIYSLGLAVLLLTFSACTNENEATSDVDALELETEAALETTYENVDQIVEIGFDQVESGARTDTNELGACAVVTHDTESKTITIDYGDGCEGRLGNVLSGQIVVTYTDRAYVPGAQRTITFVDFYFNDTKVEGTRTITNTSSSETERQFTVTLENGKLDFGDGLFATRDAEWVRTWYVGQGKVELYGSASGININGIDYSVSVSSETPITFSRECMQRLPVSGIKVMQVGEREASIDFGDGTCDRFVDVTINGTTETREIRPRRGRN
jgi:hypothetical protein